MIDKATPLHHHHHHLTRHGSSSSSVSLSSKQSKTVLPLHHKYNRQMSDRSDRSASNSPPSYRRQTHRFNSGGSFGSRQGSSGEDHDNGNDHWNNVSLPTWSANPQSPVDDTSTTAAADRSSPTSHLPHHHHHSGHHHHHHQYPYHHHSASGSFNLSYPQSWRRICSLQTLFYSICLGVGIAVALQSRGSLTESMDHLGQLMQNGHILQDMMNDAEKQIKLLHREVSAYDVMLNQQQQQHHPLPHAPQTDSPTQPALSALSRQQQQQHAPHNQALEEMQQLDARLQDAQKKAETLKRQVQALSKKEALAKYGNHVHRVELELAFPDRRDGPTKFVIELAPLDLMPHSVHFFLEMVHAGLLDGCSFILNALHVLKAAPLPYDGSSAANKARAFTRMGLESVAFKEYAPSYPHEQYTVGFAADGSPSFYINTEDNSEIHLGDPCFGKIVEGFDTVKRLEGAPTRNGIWFEQRIGIHRATVLM